MIKQRQSKVEILQVLSERTNLKQVEIELVFTEMLNLVKAHLKQQASGDIIIPKLGIKIRKIRRKATKKRTMYSPLVGQEVDIAAKPARDEVKLVALKAIKGAIVNEA